ncbi:response regulator [Polaribacter batillariae]|uniref:histidine kinase n=1 Tax=Polaribacter batillariae TaxID=2808900 RepID=A0ABX7ST23_9FLAO|nr:ATP-binding protein [Polaribacter batillariae]QTD37405.1 response regulator [Polaribacter batillariae]
MKFIIEVFSIFILFFAQNKYAQNKIEFSQLEGENVSTQSITYAIKQDYIGNIWIASEEGILKHNSKFYKVYNTYNGLPETLSNRVNEIFIAKNNNIWAGLEKGVCLYNKELDKFELISSENNINPSLVTSIDEDAAGNIWIGGFNGLWMYNYATQKIKNVGYQKPIETLVVFKNDVYCGTAKGLFKYSTETKKITKIELSEAIKDVHFINNIKNTIYGATKKGVVFKLKTVFDKISFDKIMYDFKFTVKDIIEGKNNSIYVATDGDGIYQLDDKSNIIRHFIQDSNNPSSISSNGVYDLELSSEGILWVATYGGGINYFNSKSLPFLKIQHQLNNENSLSSNFTRSIAEDKNGNLWFGTKKGLSIWNRKKNTWKHISQFDRKNKSSVIVLAIEADNNFMWIGTYNFGLYKINVNNFSITSFNDQHKNKNLITKIYAIKKDSNNTIWVGGIDKNLIAIAPSGTIKEFPILHIKSITEANNGTILAAGRNGIYRINPKNNNFRIVEDLEPSKSTLAYSSIHAVAETSNNNLIIGTNGAGIIFYNSASKKIKKLNINSGMPSDIVQGVLLENDSAIWASTTRGLVNIKTLKKDTIINIYDKKDGLASTEYNYGSYAMLNKNLMAFGGVNGVTLFDPKKIVIQEQKPKLVFDEFKLFNQGIKPSEKPLGKHINETSTILLKSNENSIEIEFTGIQHSTSSKMKYSWILEGFDEDWSKPSVNNFAAYTNLSSGNYTFKVKAINKYNFESDLRTIQIKVASPWWTTTSAFVIYGIIFILLILGVIYFTTVIMNKKNAEDQIEFFNNITHEIKTPLTILMSSLENITNESSDTTKNSNKRIKTTVKRINSLFEQMLNFHKVTSQDSIFQEVSKVDVNKYLQRRINNFKPLTEERNISIEVNNHWTDQIFYYYRDVFDKIILNLLSNAIKYSFDNGKITINLHKTPKGELQIQIADQGIGIPKDQQKFILKRYYRARNAINSQRPGTGLGLIMTKKLVEKTGGNISFESLENKGTTFTIVLKNLTSEYKESTIQEKELIQIENAIEEQTELDKFSNAKILIVEDNDELRDLLVEKLGTYFQIFEASNGVEGIEIASQHFPDIILTDLIMPKMDGMEMAKQLKENINLNHIPVFMLTVLQNSTQKLESIEAGVSEYIEKPVDIKLLLAKILNTLKFQIKLREKYVHDSDTENASLFRNQKDQDFLQDLENKVLENIENNSFSVHDLSKSFGMSRTSLYMKLKNLVDLSPQDFVIHTKLKQAKSLLIKGELSIKEVAYSSGFSNPKYFSTSFKKFYGKTPSAFIESLKNNSF